MEFIKEAMGGLTGLYEDWQDILTTAEEIEEFSGAAFDHVTGEEFLTQWQRGMLDAVETVKRLDVSGIETTLVDQIANMVEQAGGVLAQAIPDNLDTLMNEVSKYVPTDVPYRDQIIAAANLVRNNVSVEIRETVPGARLSTTSTGTSTTQSSGTQTTSTSSSADDSQALMKYLIDTVFPEFEYYEGNALSLYYRMQDIMDVSNIQSVLETELQPIQTMVTSRKTSTGGSLTMEALVREIPPLLRRLMARAISMVEDFLNLLFEAVRLLTRVLRTVRDKLNSDPNSWPDSPLKTMVQQLGLEKTPGLATVPSLLIAMVLVPPYKAATGERPTFSASVFQEDPTKKNCELASASLGFGCCFFDTWEVLCDVWEKVEPAAPYVSFFAKMFTIARGILDIATFHISESKPKEDNEKTRLETAEAWINFTKDVALSAIALGAMGGLAGYWWTVRPSSIKDQWSNYKDSHTTYNWFGLVLDVVTWCLECANLGIGAKIVCIDEEESSYDLRDRASKMLVSSLSIVDGLAGVVVSIRGDTNHHSRSLQIDGKLGVAGEKLTAKITGESNPLANVVTYKWYVDAGAILATSEEYTQPANTTTTTEIKVVAQYEIPAEKKNRVLYASAKLKSIKLSGIPKAKQTLTASRPFLSVTNPQYTWYRARSGTTTVLSGPPSTEQYKITVGTGATEVLHSDQVYVRMENNPNQWFESAKMTILDTPGTLTVKSNGTPETQAKVGEKITAEITDEDGVDPSKPVTYTWRVGNTKLDSINGATYSVKLGSNKANGEVLHGDEIYVTVTYKDKGGTNKSLKSPKPIIVMPAQGTLALEIDGKVEKEAKVGATITAKITDADGYDPQNVTYKWNVAQDVLKPPGAANSATYTVGLGANKTQGQVLHGDEISVTVTYIDKGGTKKNLTSTNGIKIVDTKGTITCAREAADPKKITITLSDNDGIDPNGISATWNVSGSTPGTSCGPGAKGSSEKEWKWTVDTNELTAAIDVQVTYKDRGGTEDTLTTSIQ